MFIDIENFINEDGEISPVFHDMIKNDKKTYCKRCNHTCLLMSDYIERKEETSSLVHSDRR
jgi:hypothetical protein